MYSPRMVVSSSMLALVSKDGNVFRQPTLKRISLDYLVLR